MAITDLSITERDIDLTRLLHSLHDSSHGAQAIFLGVVRDNNAGLAVQGMRYEAYQALAEKMLNVIAREARARWGEGLNIAVCHRTGELRVGEVSVAIIVTAPQRDEAMLANRYIIEELKKRAPIWKMERYADQSCAWLDGQTLCPPESDAGEQQ